MSLASVKRIRPQQYRLKWPLNAEQIENIDTMLETLFKATRELQTTVAGVSTQAVQAVALATGLIGDGDRDSNEIGLLSVPGPTGPQGLIGSTGPTMFLPSDAPDEQPLISVPAMAALPSVSVVTTTATGTQTDWAPGFGQASIWLLLCNNATALNPNGIAGGTTGQILIARSIGAGVVTWFSNATSAAANRLINYTGVNGFPPQLAAGKGSIGYIWDGTNWKILFHEQGNYIDEPYNSANFTAATGTWTVDVGDQLTFKYWLRGVQLEVVYDLASTSVSATPVTLRAALPNSIATATYSGSGSFFPPLVWVADNGVNTSTLVENAVAHTTQIYFYTMSGANWSTSVNNTRATAQCFIPVQ
jgi:hypothetical protein